MHPVLVAAVLACSLCGLAGTGGAATVAEAGPESTDLSEPALQTGDATNSTTTTTTERSLPMLVGNFFVRFGPSLLVITFLTWILLTRR